MSKRLTLALVLLLLVAGLAAWAFVALDPLNQIVTIDSGGMHFKGGKVNGALFNYLQRGPRPGNMTTYQLQSDGYATAPWRVVSPPQLIGAATTSGHSSSLRSIWDRWFGSAPSLRQIFQSIFSLFFMDARAVACTTDCYWVGGTGDWTDGTHWSDTSGGTPGGSAPTSTSGIHFDGLSGSGTVTQNVASLTTAGVGIINNVVLTISGGANTWTITGSWSDSSNRYSPGTSTVIFKLASGGSQLLTFGSNSGTPQFYNVTFDSSQTAGVTYGPTTNALVVSSAFTVQNTAPGATGNTVYDTMLGGSSVDITAGSVTIGTLGRLTANASTITTTGTGTVWTSTSGTFTSGTSTYVVSSSSTIASDDSFYNVTTNAGLTVGFSSGLLFTGAFTANTAAVNVTGAVNINATGAYIVFGSGSWTVTGAWTNSTTSASWDKGTGTVVFNAGGATTLTFAGANLGEDEFNNLILNSTANSTYAMATRGLRLGGALSITDTATTVGLTTSSLAVAAGSMTIGTNGTLTAGASTITINGSGTVWNSNDATATFTQGTSTVNFISTGTITVGSLATNRVFYNLGVATVGTTITISGGSALVIYTNVVTLGTGSVSGGTLYNSASASGDPFVNAGATLTTSLSFFRTAAMNMPATTTTQACNFSSTSVSYTITLTGNLSCGQLAINNTGAGATTTLTTSSSNYSIAANGTTALSLGNTTHGALIANGSIVSLTGNVNITSISSYINFGSSTWTVSGTWTNSSTSASWSAGTSSVTFTSATGGTMTFGNLGASEFNNVTFTSSAGTAQTFTMATNGLRLGGTLTISDGSSTTALTTSGSNLAVTTGAVTIGAGGILTANASTITVSGNWDSSLGTFTIGTSTLVLAATASATFQGLVATPPDVYNVTINVGVVITLYGWMTVSNVLTVNGSVSYSGTSARIVILDTTAIADPLVLGGSGSITSVAVTPLLFFFPQTAVPRINIPGGVYTNVTLYLGPRSATTVPGLHFETEGNSTFYQVTFDGVPTSPFYWNTGTYDITITYQLGTFFGSGATVAGITSTSGTWNIGGSGGFSNPTTGGTNGTGFYWTLGSITLNMHGVWNNTSTSGLWNALTSAVVFDAVSDFTNYFAITLGTSEFYDVIITSTQAGTGNYAMTQGTDIGIGHDLSIYGGATATVTLLSVGFNVTVNGAVVIDAQVTNGSWQMSSGVINILGSFTIYEYATTGGSILVGSASFSVHGNFTEVGLSGPYGVDFGSSQFYFYGSVFTYAKSYTFGTATFNWVGSGDQSYNAVFGSGIYSLVIGSGSTMVYHSKVIVLNTYTSSGGLRPNGNDPTIQFFIEGALTCTPVILNPGYSFTYAWVRVLFFGVCSTYHLAGGNYSHVEARAGSIPGPGPVTIVMDGPITTNACPIGYGNEWCAVLVTNGSSYSVAFDTQGYDITAAGNLFIGDYPATDNLISNFRTSTVEASYLGFSYNTITYLDSATLIGHPNNVYTAFGFAVLLNAIVHFGTANVTVHGAMGEFGNSPNTSWYMENSTITLLSDEGVAGTWLGCQAVAPTYQITPGSFVMCGATDFVDFGTSTWTVSGAWMNASTSASWNANAGTVNFTGSGTIATAGSLPSVAEFYTVNIAAGAAYSLASTYQMTVTNLNVTGQLVVFGTPVVGINLSTDAGYITLIDWSAFTSAGPYIKFRMSISTGEAILTITLTSILTKPSVYKDGQRVGGGVSVSASEVYTVTGPWSEYDIIIGNLNVPPPVGGGTGPAFDCTVQYVVMRYQLTCTPIGTYSGFRWYVDGQLVGTDPQLSYLYYDIKVDEVNVLVTLTVSNVGASPLSTTRSYHLDFRVNAILWVIFTLPLIVVAMAVFTVSKRPKKTTVIIQRPRSGGPPQGRPPGSG